MSEAARRDGGRGGDGGDGGGVDAAASTQRRKELHHHSRRGAGEPPAEASQRSSDGQAGEVHEASGRQNGASPSHRSSSSREASEKEDQRHGNAARGERVRNKGEPSEAAGKQRGDASPSKRSSSRKAPYEQTGKQQADAPQENRANSLKAPSEEAVKQQDDTRPKERSSRRKAPHEDEGKRHGALLPDERSSRHKVPPEDAGKRQDDTPPDERSSRRKVAPEDAGKGQGDTPPDERSSRRKVAPEDAGKRQDDTPPDERSSRRKVAPEDAGKGHGKSPHEERSSSRKAPVQEVGDQRDGAARGDRASSSNTAVERNPASTAEAPSRNSDAVHEASRRHRDRSPGKGRLALQAAQDASRARRPPSGMLTPIAAKEARLQAVQQQHNERSRALARERQQILQNQAMWTGSMAPLERVGTPEARVSARAELVGRLQAEQAAAEVLLEELRQNKSYRQAQEAAQRVAAAMAEVQHNAAQSPEPLTMPGFRDDARAPGTLGTRNSRSGRTADGAHVSVLTPGINTPQLAKTPLARRTPGSTTGHDMDTRSAFTAKSTSLVFHEPDVRRHPLDAPLPPSPPLPQQQQREMDGRTSEFVEDLRSQVAALQEAVQSQMEWQQHAAHAHMHALEQVQMQAAQQQQQQQQPTFIMPQMLPAQGGAPGTQQSTALRGGTRGGLAPELAEDPMVRQAHAQYLREMALLKMQIERAKGEAELGRLKHLLIEMRQATAELAGAAGELPPYESSLGNNGPNDVLLTNIEDGSLRDAATPSLADGTTRDRTNGKLPGSAGAPGSPYGDAGSGGSDSRDSDDEETEWDDGERLVDSADTAGAIGAGGRASKSDVLQIYLKLAGPLARRGTYRTRVVLYDGFQPLSAGPGLVVGASSKRVGVSEEQLGLSSTWNDTLTLRGLRLSPTMMLVFELYNAKPTVAGLPTREAMVAWAYTSLLHKGEPVSGTQSVPLYRLPLMISAQRKFSFGGAMLEFSVTLSDGQPGDITHYGKDSAHSIDDADAARGGGEEAKEDIPGVPAEAWSHVTRGVPPMDPFVPGEGCVLLVDSGRFLPASVTISKVVASVWSSEKRQLTPGYYEAVAAPDSNCYCPRYALQAALGQGSERFDHSTATVLFAVHTVCRWERQQRVIGYAALPLFMDPKTQQQPASKNIRDYVLNQGAFQVPLHIAPPPPGQMFSGTSLESVPRLPCASLLVRILSPAVAKMDSRKPTPTYSDRVYDTGRCKPIPVERRLYVKYLARKPLSVREAARLLVSDGQQLPGYRAPMGVLKPNPPPQDQPQAKSNKAGFMSKFLGLGGGNDKAMPTGDFDAAEDEEPMPVEELLPGQLPSADVALMDWIEDRLRGNNQRPLNYNMASEYFADLGFFVACDGAMRLERQLPSAALMTFAPPGSFYLDNPVVDDMKATLDYDMSSCLACPRWTDGFQHMDNVIYEPGLAVIFDVRLLIPTTSGSSPAGWAVLPVFEKCGQYVATGSYHLPLFQGVPSRFIIQEMAAKGDVESVVLSHLRSGRLRVSEDCPSVTVRLMDFSRQGQLPVPAGDGPVGTKDLKLPGYIAELGPKFLVTMRKQMKNRTYTKAKPGSTSESAWVQELNDCILKVAGLDMGGAAGRPHGADSPSSSSSDDNEDGGELPAAGGRGRGQPGGALPPPGSGGSVPGGRGSVAPGRTPPKAAERTPPAAGAAHATYSVGQGSPPWVQGADGMQQAPPAELLPQQLQAVQQQQMLMQQQQSMAAAQMMMAQQAAMQQQVAMMQQAQTIGLMSNPVAATVPPQAFSMPPQTVPMPGQMPMPGPRQIPMPMPGQMPVPMLAGPPMAPTMPASMAVQAPMQATMGQPRQQP